jgi:hypothetical protein
LIPSHGCNLKSGLAHLAQVRDTQPVLSSLVAAVSKKAHGRIDLFGCDLIAAGCTFLTCLEQTFGVDFAGTRLGRTIHFALFI